MFFNPYDNCKVLYLYRFIVTLRFSSNAFCSLLIWECTFFFINETLEIRFFEKTLNLSGSIFFIKCRQNHRAPAMSYECYNVYKNDIDLKTKNRQKKQRESKASTVPKQEIENTGLHMPVLNNIMTKHK